MSRIMRTRGLSEPYRSNSNGNYYSPSSNGYCMGEREEILNELSSNIMEKMYQRDSYSVRRINAYWQMSK